MPSDTNQPARQSVLQFTLRGIFLATLAAAILSAIASPLMRSSYPEVRTACYWIFAQVFAGAFMWTAPMCWRRSRVEKVCGPRLLLLPFKPGQKLWLFTILQFVAAFTFILLPVLRLHQFPSNNSVIYVAGTPWMAGFMLSQGFLHLWWKGLTTSLELCENGVIIGSTRFIPWADFKEYRMSMFGSVRLIRKFESINFRVHPEDLPEIDRLLQKFIRSKGS